MTERLDSLAHLLVLLEHGNVSLHIDRRPGFHRPWRVTFMESRENPRPQMVCAEGDSLHLVLQESFRLFEEYRTSKIADEPIDVTRTAQIDDAIRSADNILRGCEMAEKDPAQGPTHIGSIKLVALLLRGQLKHFAEGRKL